jgi:serine protease Do
VWRRGAQQEIPVTIVELQDEKAAGAQPQPRKPKPEQAPNALGLHVSDLTPQQRREWRLEGGVVVDGVQGRAATAGIESGDVILQLNNVEIKDTAQFNGLAAKLDPKKSVAVLVRRGTVSQYLVIKPRQ